MPWAVTVIRAVTPRAAQAEALLLPQARAVLRSAGPAARAMTAQPSAAVAAGNGSAAGGNAGDGIVSGSVIGFDFENASNVQIDGVTATAILTGAGGDGGSAAGGNGGSATAAGGAAGDGGNAIGGAASGSAATGGDGGNAAGGDGDPAGSATAGMGGEPPL